MKKTFVFILLFLIKTSWAQLQFVAHVSQNPIDLNERVFIEYEMNFDGDNFESPDFESSGFRVVGGPNQSISQAWVNGHSSFKKSYSFALMPLKKGTFTIKPAVIEYNGKLYKSNAVKIQVAGQENQDVVVAPSKFTTTSLFLVADISNPNPYINEPVIVTYKLYFGYNLNISGWNEIEKPKYNNFWSQNIDIPIQPEEGVYKGQRVRYAVLRKAILYPQKSGKLEIEPLTLDIDYEAPTGRTNVFGEMETTRLSKRVSSGVKEINAKALPEAGKPEDFTGAVGNFSFQVVPSRTMVKNGEPIEISLTVNGNGNFKLFKLPTLVVPDALDVYDPEHKDDVTTQPLGMEGKTTDTYTVIPEFKGNHTIKPIKFSYFDTNTHSYKTIASNEIKIEVLDGPAVAGNHPNPLQKNGKDNNTDDANSVPVGLLLGLVIAPIVGLLLFVFIKRRKKEAKPIVVDTVKQSEILAKKYLAEAKEQLGNKDNFYISLERCLHNFLKAKLHIETSEMSKDNIAQILRTKAVEENTISRFIKIKENCDFARYTPTTDASIQQDFNETAEILSEIEKELR